MATDNPCKPVAFRFNDDWPCPYCGAWATRIGPHCEVPLELRPIDAGYHYQREKEAVKLAKAKENLEAALSSDAAPVITNEDLRSIWDAQFNVDLGGKQQEAIRAAIAAVVARHLALYAPSDAAQPTDCVDCGRHYGNEYGFPDLVLPNEVWAAISPRGDGGGMLCPSCICKRLADRGFEDVPAVFRSGPCCVLAHPDDAPRPDKASQGSTVSGGERPEQVEDAPWISQYFRRQLERALVLIRRNVLPVDLPNAESRLQEAIRFLDTHPEDAPEGPWFVEHKDGCLQPAVFREAPFRVAFTGTWKECVAVRDILNCPKDAPGGPWEAVHDGKKRKTTVQLYRRPDNRYIRGLETEAEAIAVRDALNRLKGVET